MADLKVEVSAGGIAGTAACANNRAFIDRLAAGYIPAVQVGIQGYKSISMVNSHHVPIAAADGSGVNDHAGI